MLRSYGRRCARSVAVLATIGALLTVAAPATADTPPAQAERRLRVATYNLYLGADLTPLFGKTGADLVAAAAEAWAHVQATDFGERAEAIADLIVEEQPHLVGLQEVSLWQTAPLTNPGALTTRYDFLQILLDELAERGASYEAAAVNAHFSGYLPVSADTLVRWTQRNAIIARTDLDEETLVVTNARQGNFAAALPLTLGGQQITFPRGWTSVDVQFRGKWTRFANTHLEAYSDVIRKLQAHELVGILAASPHPVIVVGDLNSHRDFPGDSWQILTAAGYTDVWTETMPGVPGYTASFGDDLMGPPSELDHTVDYVLRSTGSTLDGVDGLGEVIGDEIEDRTLSGLWPSDHAGVVGTVRIVKV
jgi:endonuclease/exonuclease/phosphatase family metal-dependent hydrolase